MTPVPRRSVKELKPLPEEQAGKVKSAAKQAAAPSHAAEPAIHAGVERWPVKTGTDADVGQVGKNKVGQEDLGQGFVPTTVQEMRSLVRPSDMPALHSTFPTNSFYQDRRAAPAETTIWKLTVTLSEAKLEQDGDYHLVLKDDSGATMIGEIPMPDPAFVAATSPWFHDIQAARDAMDQKLKQLNKSLEPVGFAAESMAPPAAARPEGKKEAHPEEGMVQIGARAIVTGVGFFDSSHGQSGVAPNAIEIHPILDIEFQG